MKLTTGRIIGLTILIGSIIFLFYIGIFNNVVVKKAGTASFQLQGKMYDGSAKDQTMGKQFDELAELIKNKNSKAKLTAIFFNEPKEKKKYRVKAFIGATIPEGETLLDSSFVVEDYKFRNTLSAQQTSHPLATGVYRNIFTYAKEHQMVLDSSVSIEQYPRKDSMIIWIPIRKEEL